MIPMLFQLLIGLSLVSALIIYALLYIISGYENNVTNEEEQWQDHWPKYAIPPADSY